ncbi:hypothetical protein EBZ38_03375 [bacterium]|nr:hypothetical protein [bacterium]NDC94003.1 hypothetical protein [bacterium]NDD83308.1 hypothetical protein [bacterium]
MSDRKFCCAGKYNMYEMCSYCYNAYFSDPDFEAAMHEAYWAEHDNKYKREELKCECGGESVSDNTHSSWCPKFRGD